MVTKLIAFETWKWEVELHFDWKEEGFGKIMKGEWILGGQEFLSI